MKYNSLKKALRLSGFLALVLLLSLWGSFSAVRAGDSGGDALDFDGSDDYVQVSGYTGILGANDRTCEAWIKTTAAGGESTLIEWGNNAVGERWTVRLNGGRLRVEVEGGHVRGSTTINDGEWHHVAAVFSNDGTPDVTDVLLYVDGVLEPIGNSNSQSVDTIDSLDVVIGYSSLFGQHFLGQLDEVRIWNVARTQEQIQSFMFVDLSVMTNVEAYYKFDDGTGSITAADSSGNSRTGTLTNMDPGADWIVSTAPIADADVAGQTDIVGLWDPGASASSGGMTITDNNFINDEGDDIIFGHNNVNAKTPNDVPTTGDWASAPDPMRWSRTWSCDLSDQGTLGGSVDLTIDFTAAGMGGGPAPVGAASNYRLLERPGISGQFIDLGEATSVNTGARTVTFSGVDVSTLCSYITLGTLDDENSPTAINLSGFAAHGSSGSFFTLALGSLVLVFGSFLIWKRCKSV